MRLIWVHCMQLKATGEKMMLSVLRISCLIGQKYVTGWGDVLFSSFIIMMGKKSEWCVPEMTWDTCSDNTELDLALTISIKMMYMAWKVWWSLFHKIFYPVWYLITIESYAPVHTRIILTWTVWTWTSDDPSSLSTVDVSGCKAVRHSVWLCWKLLHLEENL